MPNPNGPASENKARSRIIHWLGNLIAALGGRLFAADDTAALRHGWQITVRLQTSMSASDSAFLVTHELDAYEGELRVHAARDTVAIPRDHV